LLFSFFYRVSARLSARGFQKFIKQIWEKSCQNILPTTNRGGKGKQKSKVVSFLDSLVARLCGFSRDLQKNVIKNN
jgi:hypothetical protein